MPIPADMKTLSLKIVGILFLATLTAACGSSHTGDPAESNVNGSNVATSLRYYKGGGFTPPGSPTWEFDLSIDFTHPAGFRATAKTLNTNCNKVGNLTYEQSVELNSLISGLTLARNAGPAVPDAQEESIEFMTSSGSNVKIYLEDIGSPVNAVVATAGATALADFFQDLIAALPTVCN